MENINLDSPSQGSKDTTPTQYQKKTIPHSVFFQGLPLVILFQPETKLSEKDSLRLREEGQNLAESLQCPFLDEDWDEIKEGAVIEDSLRALVESIKHRASGHLSIGPPLSSHSGAPDLRVIMCLHCGDPFNIEAVLGPLLGHSTCHQSGEIIIIENTRIATFLSS